MNIHEFFIKRCIQLAEKGTELAYPNPSVGCVIVHNNLIIGEGYTSPYGGNHAEVNAIKAVKDKSILSDSTLYVTLEPCSHYGKTPPCADLILSMRIKSIIIGTLDPNILVAGKGVEKLRKQGCAIKVGILEEECKELHKRFLTYQVKKRPYIILKWAESKDGFISPMPETRSGIKPVWISNQYARQKTHQLRAKEHAILVGTNTILEDNPKLDIRSWEGKAPVRILLDRNLKTPDHYNCYNNKVKTIIINSKKNSTEGITIFEKIDFSSATIPQIISVLYKHKIQSVIIEGGAKTIQSFISENLWDEAYIFKSDTILKKGIKAPELKTKAGKNIKLKNNSLAIIKND